MATRRSHRQPGKSGSLRQDIKGFARYADCVETQSNVLLVALRLGVFKHRVSRLGPKFVQDAQDLAEELESLANRAKRRSRNRSATLAQDTAQKARTIAEAVQTGIHASKHPATGAQQRTATLLNQIRLVQRSVGPTKRAMLEQAAKMTKPPNGVYAVQTFHVAHYVAPENTGVNLPANYPPELTAAERAECEAELANAKLRLALTNQLLVNLLATINSLIGKIEIGPNWNLAALVPTWWVTTEQQWPAAMKAMILNLSGQLVTELDRLIQIQTEVWGLENKLGLPSSPPVSFLEPAGW
jgi:hypothetical protein